MRIERVGIVIGHLQEPHFEWTDFWLTRFSREKLDRWSVADLILIGPAGFAEAGQWADYAIVGRVVSQSIRFTL
jgi:hypothetical protein